MQPPEKEVTEAVVSTPPVDSAPDKPAESETDKPAESEADHGHGHGHAH